MRPRGGPDGFITRPHPHPTHITRDAIAAACELLGLTDETYGDLVRLTITTTEVTVTEFLSNADGRKYVDPVTGEVPMCENRIPICSDAYYEQRAARLAVVGGITRVCGPEQVDETAGGDGGEV